MYFIGQRCVFSCISWKETTDHVVFGYMITKKQLRNHISLIMYVLMITGMFSGCRENKEADTRETDAMKNRQEEQAGYLFVGTYTKKEGHVYGKADGIDVFRVSGGGELEKIATEKQVINPSYLTLSSDGNYLYAVNETGPDVDTTGSVSAFRINPANGNLELINSRSSHAFAPCYITLDARDRLALITNYTGGVVAAYPIQSNGALGEASQVIRLEGQGPVTTRQESSHPHSVNISPEGTFAYVADLGTDKIMIYRIDYEKNRLIPAVSPYFEMDPGAGPRHMAFHPLGKYVYVINELNNTIAALRYDDKTGQLEAVHTVNTLPDDFEGDSYTADIHITDDGRFLYGSNRGHNSIAVYSIDPESGHLTTLGHEPTRGEFPRNFLIDGKNLYVANQNSDNVVLFRILDSGKLEYVKEFEAKTPVCLKIRL